LQQVGAKAFATAAPVDPAKFPTLIGYPGRRALINVGHVWVLHRRRMVQAMAALLCCAAIGGLFGARDKLAEGAASVYELALDRIAHSQFGIAKISISGQAISSERDIVGAMGITPNTSMLNFDADAARVAIEALPAVAEATDDEQPAAGRHVGQREGHTERRQRRLRRRPARRRRLSRLRLPGQQDRPRQRPPVRLCRRGRHVPGELRFQGCSDPGGDWFRLRTWRQGKRAEEADVVSRIGRRKLISADNNRAEHYALAA